jgi:hypothetical protein
MGDSFFIALAFCIAPLALYLIMVPVCAALILGFCLQDATRWLYGRLGRPAPQWSIPHTERIA